MSRSDVATSVEVAAFVPVPMAQENDNAKGTREGEPVPTSLLKLLQEMHKEGVILPSREFTEIIQEEAQINRLRATGEELFLGLTSSSSNAGAAGAAFASSVMTRPPLMTQLVEQILEYCRLKLLEKELAEPGAPSPTLSEDEEHEEQLQMLLRRCTETYGALLLAHSDAKPAVVRRARAGSPRELGNHASTKSLGTETAAGSLASPSRMLDPCSPRGGRKGIAFSDAGRLATKTMEPIAEKDRAGNPVTSSRVSIQPKNWITEITENGIPVVVDFTRHAWLPDDWGHFTRTIPTAPIPGCSGGTSTVFLSPDGQIFYHKASASAENLGKTKKKFNTGHRGAALPMSATALSHEADDKFCKLLSAQEYKRLPSKDDFHFCIMSFCRAQTVEGSRDIVAVNNAFKSAGVTPTWYVDAESVKDYIALGLHAVVGGKLTTARNMSLKDAKKKGKVCVQSSDDISSWEYCAGEQANDPRADDVSNVASDGSTRHIVSPVGVARFIVAKMRCAEESKKPQLGGVYVLSSRSRTFSDGPFSRSHFIQGDFFVVDFGPESHHPTPFYETTYALVARAVQQGMRAAAEGSRLAQEKGGMAQLSARVEEELGWLFRSHEFGRRSGRGLGKGGAKVDAGGGHEGVESAQLAARAEAKLGEIIKNVTKSTTKLHDKFAQLEARFRSKDEAKQVADQTDKTPVGGADNKEAVVDHAALHGSVDALIKGFWDRAGPKTSRAEQTTMLHHLVTTRSPMISSLLPSPHVQAQIVKRAADRQMGRTTGSKQKGNTTPRDTSQRAQIYGGHVVGKGRATHSASGDSEASFDSAALDAFSRQVSDTPAFRNMWALSHERVGHTMGAQAVPPPAVLSFAQRCE